MNKNKIIKGLSLLALSSLITTNLVASTKLSADKISELKKAYPELIGKQGMKVVKGVDQGEFSQLELEVNTRRGPQTFEVFIVKGVNAVFAGSAFSKSGEKFNLPINEKLVKEGIRFTMGSGDKQLYLVTDPECPYCTKLEKKITKEALEKYTINLIPMPLSFHKNSKAMLYYIMAGKDNKEKVERLHSTMAKGDLSYKDFKPTQKQLDLFNEQIRKGNAAANELKATGTPSLFNSNFNKIGYGILLK